MKAIILAAGRGSRMMGLTKDCPKCLVKLRGKTLLEWQLGALRNAGINEIAIVTGYKSKMLSSYGLVEFHNSRWEKTNMVSSLVCAQEWLQEAPCIVSYSDIFYEKKTIEQLAECPASLAVAYDPNWKKLWERRFEDPLIDAETFKLNSDGTLAEIGNQPGSIEEIEGQYMGLLKFTPASWFVTMELWSNLSEEQQNIMQMTSLLDGMINNKMVQISTVPNVGEWGEIDNQSDLNIYTS